MDNAFDASDQAILTKVRAFLAQGTADQKKQLSRFLRESLRHVLSDSPLPEKELSLKLELIGELHRRLQEDFGTSCDPFRFSNIQIAALSLMSVETLQDLHQDATSIMMFHGGSQSGRKAFASMVKHVTPKSTLSFWNAKEHKKCSYRDRRRCVLTKATDPIPCYIAPVDLTTSQNDMDTFTDSILMSKLMGDIGVQISRIKATESPGGFDKSWNLLCLHPMLCEYWDECLFGLKYLKMATSYDGSTMIQIEFHWMPINEIKPHQKVEPPYDRAIDAMLQTTTADIPRYWYHNLYHLKSGDSFGVTLSSKEEALKMKAVLELQWLVVRFVALSGTLKVCEYDSDSDTDEDEDGGEDHDIS